MEDMKCSYGKWCSESLYIYLENVAQQKRFESGNYFIILPNERILTWSNMKDSCSHDSKESYGAMIRRSHTCVHSRLSLVESWPRDESSFDDTWEKFPSEKVNPNVFLNEFHVFSYAFCTAMLLDSKWFNDFPVYLHYIGNGMYLMFFFCRSCLYSILFSFCHQWHPVPSHQLFYLFASSLPSPRRLRT